VDKKLFGMEYYLLMSILSAILFMTVVLFIDYHVFRRIIGNFQGNSSGSKKPQLSSSMDSDVAEENERVKGMSNDEVKKSNLVLRGLTKYYAKNFMAVNQLHLNVESCECFGLLGVNGAGKTSTFKMLTGDETITDGDAFINGISIKNDLGSIYEMISYCPQFDAVLPELTGYETLKIYSLLRGIPKSELNESIEILSKELGFHEHLHKKVKVFSGGNRRKLSVALAILGNPQLIFLDEPTTGIDVQAKRTIWDTIKKVVASGSAVILTSHSMDECEALCTKIGIMVKGEFHCLGSVQHLKNKYSKGFILTVKMDQDDDNLMRQIKDRIESNFASTELREKYIDILTFHINNADIKWSQVFGFMAQLKREMSISHYTLTQMSLEQVFLYFEKTKNKTANVGT
jgi:ATP-binding cassette, subfamily A (ABC1), member 3